MPIPRPGLARTLRPAVRWSRPVAVLAAAVLATGLLAPAALAHTAPAVVRPAVVTTTINVGANPTGIAADTASHTVYVSNQNSGTVSVISEATSTVTHTIAVGTNPQGVAVDPGTHTVWVANPANGTVSVISEATNAVIQTVNVDISGTDEWPATVAVDAPTGTVYVGLYFGYLVSISDQTYAVQQVYNTNGTTHIAASAVNPATSTVFANTQDQGSVSEISTTGKNLITSLTGIGLPGSDAIENTGAAGYPGYLYASQFGTGFDRIAVYTSIDSGPGVIWNVIHTPGQPTGVAVDSTANTLYTSLAEGSSTSEVAVYSNANSASPALTEAVATGGSAGQIAEDPAGGPTGVRTVYVVSPSANTVTTFAP
ncbi:MAG TPA: YncE family protein [Streptosporangiaceae bacterium]